MMEKKKNSIEWLVEQLLSQHGIDITRLAVTDQAKEMHEKQVKYFGALCCFEDSPTNQLGLDELYNKTFGK